MPNFERYCCCPGCGECSAHANEPKLKAQIRALRSALESIANGDGYYGAQAREYKEIARAALGGKRASVQTSGGQT